MQHRNALAALPAALLAPLLAPLLALLLGQDGQGGKSSGFGGAFAPPSETAA